ncbi:MAG: hypothetical protein KGJ43_00030 [Acidobacteriota bacterium]|nr:hypothetical protein [Acidobacteriota bacterium]
MARTLRRARSQNGPGRAPRARRAPAAKPTPPAIAVTAGDPGEAEVMFLERDQLVLDKAAPVGRATLGRAANVGLWTLRLAVTVLGAMVLYTFLSQLS